MRTIKLTIQYDGTAYVGWQIQPKGLTVQGVIEEKLNQLTGEAVRLTAASRTDAGAHAMGQVAHFKTKSRLDPKAIQRALNSLLPPDIAILKGEEAPEGFHARRDAKSKVYEYRILNRDVRSVFDRLYAWHVPQKLNLSSMRKATGYLVGEHDFSAFRSTGTPTHTAVRKVIRAQWKRGRRGLLAFEIEGSGFLKQMVRAIVGTLVEVGKGKIDPEGFREILEAKDRSKAGPTAPAHGLFLMEVKF